jgi:hypothetical protein
MNQGRGRLVALVIGAAMGGMSSDAIACGGFFCDGGSTPPPTQPDVPPPVQTMVNQAAERIVFADHGDGTVTAVIQILYEGPVGRAQRNQGRLNCEPEVFLNDRNPDAPFGGHPGSPREGSENPSRRGDSGPSSSHFRSGSAPGSGPPQGPPRGRKTPK